MTELHGYCDDRFSAVRDAFAKNFSENDDVGASVAISLEGEMVVDLWGGFRDRAKTLPWEEDTIANIWSATKIPVIVATLVCIDRGLLDLDGVGDDLIEFRHTPVERVTVGEGSLVRFEIIGTKLADGDSGPVDPVDILRWTPIVLAPM